jgi:hypothetical protein
MYKQAQKFGGNVKKGKTQQREAGATVPSRVLVSMELG